MPIVHLPELSDGERLGFGASLCHPLALNFGQII